MSAQDTSRVSAPADVEWADVPRERFLRPAPAVHVPMHEVEVRVLDNASEEYKEDRVRSALQQAVAQCSVRHQTAQKRLGRRSQRTAHAPANACTQSGPAQKSG